ncbi:putative ATP-utilizing enzyme (ATP-grasp superfamily) [Methylophaga frappieri]|uniref:Putative ATP-utilizing enzyme (ATP-grasp superfamily) n=1 Tax=Methylophaga frappieri (strain ATCC BAA-2434 / DSM 25690 / JAM7) TaxID=754477 RepID=I1YJ25_METFJ|nr:ATP-grasp domain-containing protein [Methylophaga frappieri]AFJ02918.1 putative ATP-utilizing enzyme (ATP-grasp superfamily) [Methylophaga frappieri]
MQILILEYFTSGAAGLNPDPALTAEGDAMLQALIMDLQNTPFNLTTLRAQSLLPLAGAAHQWVGDLTEFPALLAAQLEQAEATLIIAPETNHILYDMARIVTDSTSQWLGCTPEAIFICTDKMLCAEHLERAGITTITGQLAIDWLAQPAFSGPFICKPRDGAGCVETYFFNDAKALQTHLEQSSHQDLTQQLVQPYLTGQSLSLCLFISDSTCQVLSLNRQQIEKQAGQLHFHHVETGIDYPSSFSQQDAQQLAKQLHRAIPGLWGFIGVDLLHSAERTYLIEVNPRLTTAFNHVPKLGISSSQLLLEALPS